MSQTLWGHSRDTFWTLRSSGPGDTSWDTAGDTRVFGDTLGDTPGDTSGPKGPRDPCSRPGGSQRRATCVKNRQKVSKILFDTFRAAHQFSGPFWVSLKKEHKHKSFWPVNPPVTGHSPDREATGQCFVYVLSSELKEHESIWSCSRLGGPVTRATGQSYTC